MRDATRRRRQPSRQQSSQRLLKILLANLQQATSPELRERLERAIMTLKEQTNAGAR
jgi:hypothetical protein